MRAPGRPGMRLVVIDIEFAGAPPEPEALVSAVRSENAPAVGMEHSFVRSTGPWTLALCCYTNGADRGAAAVALLVRRALAGAVPGGGWSITRIREAR